LAAFGDQLVVSALLDDASLVHHDDAIGASGLAEAMGDDQRSATGYGDVGRPLEETGVAAA